MNDLTIGERIKEARKSQKRTLANLGEQIGLSPAAISMIESGKNTPSEQTVKSLARALRVREDWLRTGEGEQAADDGNNISRLTAEFGLNDVEARIVSAFVQLPPEKRALFAGFLCDLVGVDRDPPADPEE